MEAVKLGKVANSIALMSNLTHLDFFAAVLCTNFSLEVIMLKATFSELGYIYKYE